jgi:hypothetical protein
MRGPKVMATHVDGSLVAMMQKRVYSETHLARHHR